MYVETRRAISDTPVGARDVDFHVWTHLTAAFQALGLTVRGYNDPEVSVAATVGHNEAQNFANQIGVR